MTMDLFIDKQTFEIKDVNIRTVLLRYQKIIDIKKKDLMKMSDYVFLEKTVNELSKKYQYIRNIRQAMM